MGDIGGILAKMAPAEKTVMVLADGSLISAIEAKHDEWQASALADGVSNMLNGAQAPALYDELVALTEQADAARDPFRVTSIGAEWKALIKAHPPTEDEALEGWRWNQTTFWPAALAACCVDPVMDESEATQVIAGLRDGDCERLLAAIYSLNGSPDLVPKLRRGIDATDSSPPSSTTAAPEESPTLNSPE